MYIPRFIMTNKRREQLKRNVGGSKYREWKQHVIARDGGTCQMAGCNSNENIEVHHIKTWAKTPHLRHNTYNGICLCHRHHKAIQTKEHMFEGEFLKIAMINETKFAKPTDQNT